MSQYLSEFMDRLSIGGLVVMLVILIACLIIASIRSSKAPAKKVLTVCPTCGKGEKS